MAQESLFLSVHAAADPTLTPNAKLVYAVLSTMSSVDGSARKAFNHTPVSLSNRIGADTRSVKRALASLHGRGLIKPFDGGFEVLAWRSAPDEVAAKLTTPTPSVLATPATNTEDHPWKNMDSKQVLQHIQDNGMSGGSVLIAMRDCKDLDTNFLDKMRERVRECQALNRDHRPETVWTSAQLKEAHEYNTKGLPQ